MPQVSTARCVRLIYISRSSLHQPLVAPCPTTCAMHTHANPLTTPPFSRACAWSQHQGSRYTTCIFDCLFLFTIIYRLKLPACFSPGMCASALPRGTAPHLSLKFRRNVARRDDTIVLAGRTMLLCRRASVSQLCLTVPVHPVSYRTIPYLLFGRDASGRLGRRSCWHA